MQVDGEPDSYLKTVPGPQQGWMCEVCGKVGNIKTNMLRHIIGMHTGKKNLKCNLCRSIFTTENVRQIHYRRKHGLALTMKEISDMDQEY